MTVIHDTLTPAERTAFNRVRDEHMARDRMQRRENLHHKGVCWSGFSAGAYAMPSDDEMLREAKARVARQQDLEASAHGQCRRKLGELEKLVNRLMYAVHEAKEPIVFKAYDVGSARMADVLRLLDAALSTANDAATDLMTARAEEG